MGSTLFLIMLIGVSAAYDYIFNVYTANKAYAGTDGAVQVILYGSEGEVDLGKLFDGSTRSKLDTDSISSFSGSSEKYIGAIECIELIMHTSDAWMPDKVVARSSYAWKSVYFYSRYRWMSSSSGDGVRRQKICSQGDTKYWLKTTTSTKWWSGSDNLWASITIHGSKGDTETGILDLKDFDDFESGHKDTYIFPGMKDVGHVSCITINARGTDGWLFTEISVFKYRIGDTPMLLATFVNHENVWMDSNVHKFCKE